MGSSFEPWFYCEGHCSGWFAAASLTWRRWKGSDEKLSWGRIFNGKVNSDHEAAVKSVQEFGL